MTETKFGAHPRQLAIEGYVNSLDMTELDTAEQITQSLLQECHSLARTCIIIPVAAHQEAAQIPIALAQFAKQEGAEDFTVVLGLNCPPDKKDTQEVDDCLVAIETAKDQHPFLDVRTSFVTYERPVIGKIRRDLWNGVAMAAEMGGNLKRGLRDVIGVSNDIDIINLSSDYISRIQKQYRKIDQLNPGVILPISSIQLKHASSTDHPNSSQAIFWLDYVTREAGDSWEAGLIFPLSYYAEAGGFAPYLKIHESQFMIAKSPNGVKLPVVTGARLQTSPRRLLGRLGTHNFNKIWTPESFGPMDECRDSGEVEDISRERTLEVVGSTVQGSVFRIIKNAVDGLHGRWPQGKPSVDELYAQLAAGNIERRIEKSRRRTNFVLDRVLRSEELAAQAKEYFDPTDARLEARSYLSRLSMS